MDEDLLQDLEDLGGEEDLDIKEEDHEQDEKDDDIVDQMEEDRGDALLAASVQQADNVKAIAKLSSSRQFKDVLKRIEHFKNTLRDPIQNTRPVEEDPEYSLIVEANNLTVDIDNEILVVHKFIRDHYAPKFPDLEHIVPNPLDYAKTVKCIGNEMDMTRVDLTAILPSQIVMIVTVTATTTNGHELSEDEISRVLEACDIGIELDTAKKRIFEYVESRMSFIAPNLSALVGSNIAAKLMGLAGGVTALGRIPASNLLVVGREKKTSTGLASGGQMKHGGIIYQCGLVQNTPTDFKKNAARKISGKCVLAARMDAMRSHTDGSMGEQFRSEIEKALEVLQAPPPGKAVKALPIPEEGPKKRRAGKRVRAAKQKMRQTELAKAQNRMAFGVAEEEVGYQGGSTKGLGLIGGETGKVRAAQVDTKANLHKKIKTFGGSSGATSGISSSVAFTPVKGIELENPEAAAQKAKKATDRYFSGASFFKVPQKRKQDREAIEENGSKKNKPDGKAAV
ncbi:U4/U6-U5 snRNP complex subunit prp31 [Borealophlyctis nickersoniae]|nr:U4/U6-U5 snRNP complex subunit prp31 [Borealophlyctis nickersoniae]